MAGSAQGEPPFFTMRREIGNPQNPSYTLFLKDAPPVENLKRTEELEGSRPDYVFSLGDIEILRVTTPDLRPSQRYDLQYCVYRGAATYGCVYDDTNVPGDASGGSSGSSDGGGGERDP